MPYGNAVYICGWIQGISPETHKAIEWVRNTARDAVQRHREYKTEMQAYEKKLEDATKAALAKLLPSKEQKKKASAESLWGEDLHKIKDRLQKEFKKGAKECHLFVPGPGNAKRTKVGVQLNGEAPPQLTPDPVLPNHMKEVYRAWENAERAAGRKPPGRCEMDQPLSMPAQIRDRVSVTTRDWIKFMMRNKKQSYGAVMLAYQKELGWLTEWGKKHGYDCW